MIEEILETQKAFFNSDDKENFDIFKITNLKKKNYDGDHYHIAGKAPGFNKKKMIKKLKTRIPEDIYDFIVKNKIVVAGGIFSSSSIFGPDIDLFILDENYNKLIDEFCEIIFENGEERALYNRYTITFTDTDIQIVLRLYSSISEILHGFDIGASCIAFDGENFYTTSMGKFAYEYGYNIVDMSLRSTTYEKRLAKYFDRNFGIILPKLRIKKITSVGASENIILELGYMYIAISKIEGKKIYANLGTYDTSISAIYNSSKTALFYMSKFNDEKYSRSKWELHSKYKLKSSYPHLAKLKMHPGILKKKIQNEFEKMYNCEMRKLLHFGYEMKISDPTSQKFGMFDPADTTDEEWYNGNI